MYVYVAQLVMCMGMFSIGDVYGDVFNWVCIWIYCSFGDVYGYVAQSGMCTGKCCSIKKEEITCMYIPLLSKLRIVQTDTGIV